MGSGKYKNYKNNIDILKDCKRRDYQYIPCINNIYMDENYLNKYEADIEKEKIKKEKLEKCNCIDDGKKNNSCDYWDGKNKKPWCYTDKKQKCGTYSKYSKKYYKYCTKSEVDLYKKKIKNKTKKEKEKIIGEYCRCGKAWPCYDYKTKTCKGTGNSNSYPNDEDILRYCKEMELMAC